VMVGGGGGGMVRRVDEREGREFQINFPCLVMPGWHINQLVCLSKDKGMRETNFPGGGVRWGGGGGVGKLDR
jgi:hypothetical protein